MNSITVFILSIFCNSDMIALPDFRPGAMENWGLVTYRERAMLFYKGVGSEENRQYITQVITHELAHQVQ